MSTDGQNRWLIKEARSTISPYISINETCQLLRIGLPDTQCNVRADDDLFIIYEDGSYYNSRNLRMNRFTENPELNTKNFPKQRDKNLNIRCEKKILYMYHTDVYDNGGRPPTRLSPNLSTNANEINSINIDSGEISQNILSANHDVVSGEDFTLIINGENLADIRLKPFSIHFEIEGYTGEIFETSEVFSGDFIYPNVYHTELYGDSILISDSIEKYYYINLVSIHDLLSRVEGEKSVKFTLKQGGVTIDSLYEKILKGHDPNIMALKKVCTNKTARYYVSFHNNGIEKSNDLSVYLDLNELSQINNVCLLNNSVKYQGETYNAQVQRGQHHQEFIIIIDSNLYIWNCDSDIENGIKLVEFEILIEFQNGNLLAESSLKPSKATVWFDNSFADNLRYEDWTCKTSQNSRENKRKVDELKHIISQQSKELISLAPYLNKSDFRKKLRDIKSSSKKYSKFILERNRQFECQREISDDCKSCDRF